MLLLFQWDKYPAELDAAVLARLPYREDKDDRWDIKIKDKDDR